MRWFALPRNLSEGSLSASMKGPLVPFLRRFRARFGDTKTIWCYTGCVLEQDLLPEVEPSRWRTEVTDEFLALRSR